MFCIICGCHIPPNAKKCPDCNNTIANMEYCNGFWQELNQNMPVQTAEEKNGGNQQSQPDRRKKEVSPAPKKVGKKVKQRQSTPAVKTVLIAESAIIALLILYTAVSGASHKGRLHALQEQIELQEASIDDLNQDLGDAEETNAALQEQVAAQQKEIAGLKQGAELEEETYVSEEETYSSEESNPQDDERYGEDSQEYYSQSNDQQGDNQQENTSWEEESPEREHGHPEYPDTELLENFSIQRAGDGQEE